MRWHAVYFYFYLLHPLLRKFRVNYFGLAEIASLPAKTAAGYVSFLLGRRHDRTFCRGAVAAAIQADVVARSLYERCGGAGDDFNHIGRSRGESLHASGRILLAAENCSELKLQGQLDRARAADLIERVETAIRAAGSQAAGQRLRRLAEQCVGQVVVGRAEVRVVEEVEELASETKPHLLGEMKLPLKRDIGLPGSETPQHIAAEIALLPGGRWSKCCWIERLAAGILRPIEHKRHSGHYVRARVQRDAVGEFKSANHIHRRSRPRENEAIHRPAAQRSVGHLV